MKESNINMSLLHDIRINAENKKALSSFSLETIRVVIEACDCPKSTLCDTCKNLLAFYKWKDKENKKYVDKAVFWIMHQCCLIFFGSDYKERNLHFSKDVCTLKEIVELYEEYRKERERKA